MKISHSLQKMRYWLIFGLSLALADISCDDYPECNGDFLTQNPFVYCGVRVSNSTRTGPKCIYLLKKRDKDADQRKLCESLSWNNGNEIIKTGKMVTLNNMVENNMTADYINLLGKPDGSSTVYWAYAYIGLRKTCRDCPFKWHDNEPVTFTNWYGNEPNSVYYDCTHIRTTGTYDKQWIDMSCSGAYPAVCQFFKSGHSPIPPKPTLPARGGCKEHWWKYGGYCYRDFGHSWSFGENKRKTYPEANSSCWAGNDGDNFGPDWPESRMAILPTLQHNILAATVYSAGRHQHDLWIGVYNHAYYDYYFSLDNFDTLTYDNWAPGYPNHLHGNIDKCAKMKYKTETNFQGTAKIGQWINQHCTNNKQPWICSHPQDP